MKKERKRKIVKFQSGTNSYYICKEKHFFCWKTMSITENGETREAIFRTPEEAGDFIIFGNKKV